MTAIAPSELPAAAQASSLAKPPRSLVPLALASVYVIWGSTYLALAWMIEGLPPLSAAGARYLAAGAILYGIMRLRGLPRPTARQWLGSVPAGVLLFVVGNGFVTLAQREVASSVAAIVCAAMPLVTVVLGLFIGERVTGKEVVGLLVGFAGVAVMTAERLAGASLNASILLLAPVGWAAGSLLARKTTQPVGLLGPAAQMLSGGLAMLLLGIGTGEHMPAGPVPMKSIAAFVYLVVAGSLVAFTAYSYLLRNTRPAIATSYAYVNPGIAVVLGVFLANEAFTRLTALGGILVIAGVLVVVRAKSRAAMPAK